MDFDFTFKKSITESALIEEGDHLLVAVSGGLDSMMLLHLLHQFRNDIGIVISVAHINHNLRGDDSDKDEAFVKSFCEERQIPFYSRSWDCRPGNENIQDAARQFRHRAFKKIAAEIGADKIVLAHHQNDQVETLLQHLIRGSGLEGLGGMESILNLGDGLTAIRPLLQFPRHDIEAYANDKGVAHREDQTNCESKYERNFIRHQIIPLLLEKNPNLVKAISEMTRRLREDESLFREMTKRAFDEIASFPGDKRIEINAASFQKLHLAIRKRVIREAYGRLNASFQGLNSDQLDRMDQISSGPKREGEYSLPNGIRFEKRGRVLALSKD